jgi:hypothetical protein
VLREAGKFSNKKITKALEKISIRYKRFELGKIDCVQLFYKLYSSLGIKIKKKYKDVDIDTYASLIKDKKKSMEELKSIFTEYIISISDEVHINFICAGDIIIYNNEFSIYVGRQMCIMMCEEKKRIVTHHIKQLDSMNTVIRRLR